MQRVLKYTKPDVGNPDAESTLPLNTAFSLHPKVKQTQMPSTALQSTSPTSGRIKHSVISAPKLSPKHRQFDYLHVSCGTVSLKLTAYCLKNDLLVLICTAFPLFVGSVLLRSHRKTNTVSEHYFMVSIRFPSTATPHAVPPPIEPLYVQHPPPQHICI